MSEKYVIIGNSIAACGAIEGIRSVDKEGSITVLSKEDHPVYGRPLISYILEGKTTKEKALRYRPADFYETNRVTVKYATEATGLDREAKTVTCSDGSTVAYDKLLLATGSDPFVPPTAGYDTVKKKFTFLTLDDAEALGETLSRKPDSRVLIVGAGLIGLKCAEGIAARCGSITVVDMAPRILASILSDEPSAIMKAHLEKTFGIRFLLSDVVERYEGDRAVTKNGETIDFDVLVTAVGVRPNVGLARAAGLEVGRGILVDTSQRTSDPAIFAAGDCAEGYDASIDARRVLAILPNASLAGRVAGKQMAGDADAQFGDAVPMNSIGFGGLHILSAGEYSGEERKTVEGDSYRAFYLKDGRLAGFQLIGKELGGTGIYTSLVRERTELSDVDVERMLEKPQLMALSPALRRQKLKIKPEVAK